MATTLLVGISWQTPVEKYLDNADDKRLLNLICKLEGWHGAERKGGRDLQPSFSRCWQDEKGRIQVYGLFAVFNGGWMGEVWKPVRVSFASS